MVRAGKFLERILRRRRGRTRHVSDDNPYISLEIPSYSVRRWCWTCARRHRIHSNYLSYPPQPFTASDYNAMGIPASVQSAMPISEPRRTSVPGHYTSAALRSTTASMNGRRNSQISGTVTRMAVRTLKPGAEYRVYQGNYTDFQFAAEQYRLAQHLYCAECDGQRRIDE